MDGPPPPRDASLHNIIDKLAEFVARNGPDFEMITKQKQQGNPKFDFLYGGEFASYYQYRVAAEQAFLKQQGSISQGTQQQHHMQQQQQLQSTTTQQQSQQQPQQQQQQHPPPGFPQGQQPTTVQHYPPGMPVNSAAAAAAYAIQQQQQQQAPPNHIWGAANVRAGPPPTPAQGVNATNPNNNIALNLTAQLEAINMQQNTLREQIHQSETNLTAQHSALMTQQNKQIEEAIELAQSAHLDKIAEENGIALPEFDAVLQPIIESCTKDSISAGKNWILQHSTDSAKNNVVLQYLLKKALVNGSTFQQKLHLIYLVNDVLHHCVRKKAEDLKNSLENVVIPMFCSADLLANPDQRSKLQKLLSLWESKAKFFDACVISKLQSPDSSMLEYKTNRQNLHHEITTKIAQNTKQALENYQKQHQVFIQHTAQQITQLEQQKQTLEQHMFASMMQGNTSLQMSSQTGLKIPALMAQKIAMPGGNSESDDSTVNGTNSPYQQQQQQEAANASHNHYQMETQQQTQQQQQQKASFFIPDMTKPPPGFLGASAATGNPVAPGASPGGPAVPVVSGNGGGGGVGVGVGSTGGGAIGTAVPAAIAQLPPPLQQQLALAMANIPQLGSSTNAVDTKNAFAPTANIDILAMQLLQQQQKQQQQQQQQQQQHLQQQLMKLQQQQQQQKLDLSKPTPEDNATSSVPPSHYMDETQRSSAAYYDLPAGLMVPLIRLEDYSYKPLDPTTIRLPPPAPQSERLTNALAAFYAPPTHDRPRDTEGWEKLGLYEYYKVKNSARKQKEDDLLKGAREKSRSPSPILVEKPKPKKINKRVYTSKSRSRSRSKSPQKSSRSRSITPPLRGNREGRSHVGSSIGGGNSGGSGGASAHNPSGSGSSGRNNRSYQQRNRSPRRSPPSRDRGDRDRDSSSRENRSERSNTRRERERSVTPPSFFGSSFTKTSDFIEESNKGHQMLMKMGWAGTGSGLGTKNQGIEQPISAGEVRDRRDLYKGVGVNLNDPFENFRKNKGAAFVHRMRSRDDKH